MTPLIGISAYREQARWGVWDLPASVLPQNYVDQVAAAGGTPVLLPPVPGIEAAVPRLDGLIISGGPDIEPARYGERPGPMTTVVRPERDAAELAMLRAALDAGVPVLGICRGMQLMNVALGGTLIQHLPDVVGHDGHSPTPGGTGSHEVTVGPESRLARILGPGVHVVLTHHHQGLDRLAAGLTATAWATDGTIEAVEAVSVESVSVEAVSVESVSVESGPADERAPFVLGVQWHPEAGEDPALFEAIVEAGLANPGLASTGATRAR